MKGCKLGLALALAVLLGACRDADIAGLEQALDGMRVDPASVKLAPLPEMPEYVSVDYLFGDQRSPFEAPRAEGEEIAVSNSRLQPDSDRVKEPLEAFSLDQLALVGTLTISGKSSALVRDPEGIVHRLHVGNRLGLDFGRIVGITGEAVQLVEIVPTGRGGWVQRTNMMTLDS
ncbi:MAG TPA: pilus assembly protein PilP [Halomonas sp.]|nr:pilus assembly protein PilP [Halomonas sp.]